MPAYPDILDEQDSLRRPLAGSVAFHLLLAGALIGVTFYKPKADRWGDPLSAGAGGVVAISPVATLPLPDRGGRTNRVANDTDTTAPAPPKPQPKTAPKDDPDAIPLPSRNKKDRQRQPMAASRMPEFRDDRPNQVYSRDGQRLSSPMYGGQAGAPGVGIGNNSPFGNRFGYYEKLLRERVSRFWRTDQIPQNAPAVVVTFTILRDGSTRNIRVTQSSGNYAMDTSAQRAILDASPLPQLPPGYERDSADVEFWFRLQR